MSSKTKNSMKCEPAQLESNNHSKKKKLSTTHPSDSLGQPQKTDIIHTINIPQPLDHDYIHSCGKSVTDELLSQDQLDDLSS